MNNFKERPDGSYAVSLDQIINELKHKSNRDLINLMTFAFSILAHSPHFVEKFDQAYVNKNPDLALHETAELVGLIYAFTKEAGERTGCQPLKEPMA